jgi:hypothetical protein
MVESSSGMRDCDGGTEGKFCTFDLTAVKLPYTETFTVTAKPGYRFVKWQKAVDFKCGDSTDPACTITASNNELGKVIMASFWTGYLMPVFEYLGVDTDGDGVLDPHDADDDNDGLDDDADDCPLTWPDDDGSGCPEPLPDSIIVNGKEWAQSQTFVGVSWKQINDVCPPVHGLNLCHGQLNGVDLRGWRWATTSEVTELLNTYSGSENRCDSIAADFVFGVDTIYGGQITVGWVSETSTTTYLLSGASHMLPCYSLSVGSDLYSNTTGGWFYRLR